MPQRRLEYDDYLKFIDDALELAKVLPKYFSKYSNHIYCNQQKFSVYILMQKLRTTSRGIISYLRSCSEMKLHLGPTKVPVHTTIIRFAKKIPKFLFQLFSITKADTVAVDATGFELESKSYYYRKVEQGYRRKKTKKFMKLNLAVDTKTHSILSYKVRKSCAHESQDFKTLLNGLQVKYVVADTGYSSKKLRDFVVHKLKAIPLIPKKKNEGHYHLAPYKILVLDRKRYHKRSNIENIFFCIKRKYSSILRNRTSATQKVELISKLIAHNVDIMQHYLVLILKGLHHHS